MSKCPIGYNNILAWLVKEYHRIGAFKMSTDKKNERLLKAANQAKLKLWVKVTDTRPVKEKDKYHEPKDEQVTASTHNKYLTRLRRDLEEAGLFDYDFKDSIHILIESFPYKAKELELIASKTTYKDASRARTALIKKLEAALKRSKKEATKANTKNLIDKLSNLKIEHFLNAGLTRTSTEKRNMAARESDRKAKYQKRPRQFSGLKMIETIYRLIKTGKPENLAIACAMSCGRRCVEVLHFAHMEKFNNTRLTFTGMRKSKVKAKEVFKIPVIIEPELFLEALDKLRNSDFATPFAERLKREKVHEAEIARRLNGSVSGRLNEQINKEFNFDLPESEHIKWTFKDTRAIYARLSYAIYCANMKKANKEPVQEIEYFKTTLLHTDHNETLNYLQFRLTDADALTAYNIKKAKEAADALEFVPQHELIKPLLSSPAVKENRTMMRVIPLLVEWLRKHGEYVIDTSFLRKTFGGKTPALTALLGLIKDVQAHEPRLVVKEVKKSTKKMITKRIEVTTVYTFTKREMVEVQLKEGATDEQWQTALDNAAENASEYSYDSFSVYDADEMETDWELDDEWTDELDESDE